jgi:hypothetical protein
MALRKPPRGMLRERLARAEERGEPARAIAVAVMAAPARLK